MEFLILASDGLWDVVPNEVSAIYQIWYMYLHYFLFK
jgi:serine/threonine protein phosphatase PrpC